VVSFTLQPLYNWGKSLMYLLERRRRGKFPAGNRTQAIRLIAIPTEPSEDTKYKPM
jgi:hypothetical protein